MYLTSVNGKVITKTWHFHHPQLTLIFIIKST